MGAGPNAQVVAAAPDVQIVPARPARPGMVGNLIRRQASSHKDVRRCFEQLGAQIFFGGLDALAKKRRTRLDGQLIDRYVITCHHQGIAEHV